MEFVRYYVGSDPVDNLCQASFDSFVEVDVDGVLTDTIRAMTPYLRKFLPDFTPEKYILEWNFASLYDASPEAYECAFGLLNDADFLGSLKPLVGVSHSLWDLHSVLGVGERCSEDSPWVILHTHIPSTPVPTESLDVQDVVTDPGSRASVRLDWCMNLIRGLRISGVANRFAVVVDTGDVKASLCDSGKVCLALFEDNLMTVKRSGAVEKYLIRGSHNQEIPFGRSVEHGCTICSSFSEAVCRFVDTLGLFGD